MARNPKLRLDANEIAFRTLQAAIGEGPKPTPPGQGEKNPEAANRGRKGGKVGGKVRAAKLSKERQADIAKGAAKKRWEKPDA